MCQSDASIGLRARVVYCKEDTSMRKVSDQMPKTKLERSTSAHLESRDWLGRGGLMGLPWIAFPSHLAGIATRLYVYGMSAIWLIIAFQYFIWQLPLLVLMMIPVFGDTWYKRACSIFDTLARPAILATPYSWCGFRVHTNSYKQMSAMIQGESEHNVLVMTNHCSRVDWLVGMLLGDVLKFRPRIGFVAEITTMLMPVFGWSRFLFGDIFLRRTFHRDSYRIQNNIKAFHEAKVPRMLFVAPEGAIVDPGVAKDEIYVRQCQQFMQDQQRPKLQFLLTPRYKGIQLLSTHCTAPDATFSVTMSFVCRAAVNKTNGNTFFRSSQSSSVHFEQNAVAGGELCTRALCDSQRIVPDLHTVFRGGLHVFCHIHPIHFPATASHELVRDLLLDDYERKDKLLSRFATDGTFLAEDVFYTLPISHVRMNATLLLHSALSVRVALMFYPSTHIYDIVSLLFVAWLIVVFLHATSHLYAEKISGASRESLLFETIFKSVIEAYLGKLNHGSSSDSIAS